MGNFELHWHTKIQTLLKRHSQKEAIAKYTAMRLDKEFIRWTVGLVAQELQDSFSCALSLGFDEEPDYDYLRLRLSSMNLLK